MTTEAGTQATTEATSEPEDTGDRGPGSGSTEREDDLSGLIRRARRRAKLSQRELAHDLGVSQSAVAKWETGRTEPSARMLTRILRMAGLHLVAVGDDAAAVRAVRVLADGEIPVWDEGDRPAPSAVRVVVPPALPPPAPR